MRCLPLFVWLILAIGCAAPPVQPVQVVSVPSASAVAIESPDDEEPIVERRQRTPITEQGLYELMERRFADQVAAGQLELEIPEGLWPELEGELDAMGIEHLEQLEALIPRDFDEMAQVEFEHEPNVLSLTRTLLMLHDLPRYFDEAWQGHWHSVDTADFATLRAYGVDLAPAGPSMDLGSEDY